MDDNQKIIFEAINFASFIFFFSLLSQSGEWGVRSEVGTDIAYTIYTLLINPKLGKTIRRENNVLHKT